MYTNTDYNIYGAIPLLFISPCWVPFAPPSNLLRLLGNSPSCDRICPPWSQVACKLTSPFSFATTRKVLILLLQEIKHDIVYRRAQLQRPRRREELHPRIQAHLILVINKISSLLEYQGTLQFADGLSFLQRLSRIILQAWNSSSHSSSHPSYLIHLTHLYPPCCVDLILKKKSKKNKLLVKPV